MGTADTKQKLTIDDVRKIASLSKLRLDGAELETMAHDFNGILGFVAQISEANTEGALALDHPLGVVNADRSDASVASIPQEAIRAFAPKFEAGFFVVPQVIETDV